MMFMVTYCPRLSSVAWNKAAIVVGLTYVCVGVIYLVMKWSDGCRV